MASYGGHSCRKTTYDDGINLVENPEQYMRYPYSGKAARGGQANPKNWSKKKTIIISVVASALILFAVLFGAIYGIKVNRYPDYSKLDYSLQDTYQGTDFFDRFNYFTGYDPTQGFVHYVDQPGSEALNLTYVSSNQAILRVDTSEKNASTGRKSARIQSKTQYNSGLFLFDITHSPYGCGTWSSVWLADESNWPYNGEIDVVESVNQGVSGNQMTLHTTDDCSMKSVKRKQEGNPLTTNCLNSTDNNAGCGVQGAVDTFGEAFNNNEGGVYALEWRDAGIRTWFFQRSAIPSDVQSGSAPDPSSWGIALADFPSTECDMGSHFKNQSIIVNIDLCGTWAGTPAIYSEQDQCPGLCSDFVATNATAFENAFWSFNSFKVYQAA